MNYFEQFHNLITSVTQKYNVSVQDLSIKSIVSLRKYSQDQLRDLNLVLNEVEDLASQIQIMRKRVEKIFTNEPLDKLDKHRCSVRPLNHHLAKQILEKYHYIGSYRKQSLHLGLFYKVTDQDERVMGLITFSKYDFRIKPYGLFSLFKEREILNLSRLYTFDWVPYNTTSYFMSQAIKYLKESRPKIKCLITCANPNTGHGGASYRASNWLEIAQFDGAPYLFLDNKNVTIRHLFEKYKTLDLKKIKAKLGERLIISDHKLLPQKIFFYPLKSKERKLFYKMSLDKVYFFNNHYFVPEYGLTGYDQKRAITFLEAKQRIKKIGGVVLAGYLEKDTNKLYSSVVVKSGNIYQNIRKEKRWRDEFIADSNQPPPILNLPFFGRTLILLCYDAKRYSENNMCQLAESSKIDSIIVLSYWKNNFGVLSACIGKLRESLKPTKVICYDFFHGFNLMEY
jgi:hypothetical protein